MSTTAAGNEETFQQRLEDFKTGLATLDRERVPEFYADDVDYRGSGGVLFANAEVTRALRRDLSRRASSEVVAMRRINRDFALVDSVFDDEGARGWFTEVWAGSGDDQTRIVSTRTRYGTPEDAFGALSELTPQAVAGRVDEDTANAEFNELQTRFRAFRTAFNSGDSAAVMSLFSDDSNAIVAFSFLNGRAQILDGQDAMATKSERMMGEAVSNPDPSRFSRLGAVFVGGQPKTVRFLAKDLAVVDGTAEIAGIPAAHGFSPSAMTGVYTNFWSKAGGEWQCVGARPWF
jgi:hypothetical protein